jgi:hypothetical protein
VQDIIGSVPEQSKYLLGRSFPEPINNRDEVRAAVVLFTKRIAEKLRRARVAAGTITVFVQMGRFATGPQYANWATVAMIYLSDSTQALLQTVLGAM